ncbi:MAG: hypothetical protein J5I50_05575 [Chitinophagaceae bacterium]|nr:hypothetical protein [Chitinophagaceae bacterium]
MGALANYIYSTLDAFTNDKDELENIVKNSPASPLPKLLLLRKKIEEGEADTSTLLQSLALQTSNPRWLSFVTHLLNQKPQSAEEADVIIEEDPEVQQPEPKVETEQIVIGNEEEVSKPELSHAVLESEATIEEGVEEPGITEDNGGFHQEEQVVAEDGKVAAEDNNKKEAAGVELEITNEGKPASGEGNTIATLEEFKGTITEGANEPLFEPLHTVDYFASQGIRLKEEDLDDDKLGRQLKSFTGWLKSMKKLHPDKVTAQDEAVERIIRASAENSNIGADVLTEAMAEVLVKQDKKDKAIEMYEKLKLMNPSKSAYFAAKIENLKQ